MMNSLPAQFIKERKRPIWFMRQAGRYMSEYMQIRKNVGSFLDLCYDSEKAAEVTLQPLRRFDFSGAIIFSDILVLPHALGWDVRFEENVGPVLRQFKNSDDLKLFDNMDPSKLEKVYAAIKIVKANLAPNKFLIGFAGSPWTVVSYLLEGRGKQDFSVSKRFLYQNRELSLKLIDVITDNTIMHLAGQIKAGCDIVQLFDSWAGMLSEDEYLDFVITPTRKIVSKLKEMFPEVPIIGFPKGSGFLYDKYIKETGIDILGVDQFIPVSQMRQWQDKLPVQGNFDPVVLLTDKENIKKCADKILSNLEPNKFIFNLGHGIMPTTPVENVEFLVNYVNDYKS